MHRWFFANYELLCKDLTPPPGQPEISGKSSTASTVADRNWLFEVRFDWKLCSNEFLAICGSCPSLGKWNLQLSLPLIRTENSSIWSLRVSLPSETDIHYRYLVCALNYKGRIVVRFWETHLSARLIRHDEVQTTESVEHETFGLLNNIMKIERGWLNEESNVVQFKFYQAPFLIDTRRTNWTPLIKITPIRIKTPKSYQGNIQISPNATEYIKTLNDNLEEKLGETFAFCEVASLQDQNGDFRKQPQYGTPWGPDHFIIFNITLDDKEHTGYLINLYKQDSKSGVDIPPSHFGYQYVLPQELKDSEGKLQLLIMSATKHRPIGAMQLDYLVVKPMAMCDFNLEKTFQRHWDTKHEGLLIGHRGCGKSFCWQKNVIRENTVKSLNLAIEHGADMVEFDVQLTKDMVPILFHDYQLNVAEKFNIVNQDNDIMYLPLTATEIDSLITSENKTENKMFPLSGFTLEQLKRVKVYEPINAPDNTGVSQMDNSRPFSTLEEVLKQIDAHTGFVIDIKWPQNGTADTAQEFPLPVFDKNEFVDLILQVVLKNASSRRIVFSSHDADICTMVRLKQNIYPIMFLIQPCVNGKQCVDPRNTFISTGISFASAMDLLGICVNSSDIFEIPGKISNLHNRDLCVFSWGIQNRAEETRKSLKTLGVDGIICDRINHALTPDDLKENLFFILPLQNPLESNKPCLANA